MGSVFDHPIGLPLMAAWHGKVLPESLAYPVVAAFPEEIGTKEEDENGDTILLDVVSGDAWSKDTTETDLAAQLREKIKANFQEMLDVTEEKCWIDNDGRTMEGRMDLVFHPEGEMNSKNSEAAANSSSTPLGVIQVGRTSDDWWTKFYQGFQSIKIMRRTREGPMCFRKPLLLVVMTVDDKHDFDFCMGVFLCTPNKEVDFRMSLIWHKQIFAKKEASKSFGLLLRILDHFQLHRDKDQYEAYEYFKSNCCRVGDMVGGAVGGLLQDPAIVCVAKTVVGIFVCFHLH